jgi:hypothetical protein
MPSPAILSRRAVVALAAALVTACGGNPSVESATAVPSAARLPAALGPLEAGAYLTPDGFDPAISIMVPDGWYGFGGQSGFAVGKGLNESGEFADAGLYAAVVPLPYDEATATFEQLEGVVFSEPTSTMELDGHAATVFHGSPSGDAVLLDELVPGIDLNALAHEQIFVDVDGQTVFIRAELPSDDAEGALAEVIDSMRFP